MSNITDRREVADRLRKAKALIERGWTRGCGARDINGNDVWGGEVSAVRWCALSAITTACSDLCVEALQFLRRAINLHGEVGIPSWNDAPGRTQAEVLAAFDKAITLADSSQ